MIRADSVDEKRRSSITIPSLGRRISREQTVYSDDCPVSPTLMPPPSPPPPRMSHKNSRTSLDGSPAAEPAVPLPAKKAPAHAQGYTGADRGYTGVPQALAHSSDDSVAALAARFEAVTRDLVEKMDAQSSLLDRMFAHVQRIDKESEATTGELALLRKELERINKK